MRRTTPGDAPGTLRVDPDSPRSVITVFAYGPDQYAEKRVSNASEVRAFLNQWPVTWINVDGLGDAQVLQELGDLFQLHRLALEDVVNVHQRAKVEPYGSHLYIVAQMARVLEGRLDHEQISIFVGKGFVLSFQEKEGDVFDPIRDRIRLQRGRVRQFGPDYLVYALLDTAIDAYFPCIEHYGDRLENIEAQIIERPDSSVLHAVNAIRRDLLVLRRAVWPAREAISALLREEVSFIAAETRLHMRDCYDHVIQIIDMLETYRELASGQMDLYLSTIGHRTNEIMKVLTMFAALFIPLSFIAGLYGMNFVRDEAHPWNMPELSWPYGYPMVLGVMAIVAGGLLMFFRHKGWLGGRRKGVADHDSEGQSG